MRDVADKSDPPLDDVPSKSDFYWARVWVVRSHPCDWEIAFVHPDGRVDYCPPINHSDNPGVIGQEFGPPVCRCGLVEEGP